jgi:hypothetical protein
MSASAIAAADGSVYEEEIQRLLAWLPDDTESLIVLRDPDCHVVTEGGFATEMPCASEGALSAIRGGKFRKRLSDCETVVALQAAGGFREPTVVRGRTQYAGCQLVLFKEDIADTAKALIKDMAAVSDGVLEIAGRRVLRFDEEWHRQKWTFLVSFPTPHVLIVATDEHYLRELLVRIDDSADATFVTNERLKAELPLDASFWVLRQYKAKLRNEPGGSQGFLYRATDWSDVDVIFVADDDTPPKAVAAMWTLPAPLETVPDVRHTGMGVFKVEYSFDERANYDVFWMLLLHHLGHQADL